jgi:amino acid permease
MEMELISGEDASIHLTSINQSPVLNRALSTTSNTSLFNYIKEGSAISSVTILLASSLGSNIIVIPNSIRELGIYLGLLILLLALFINYFASYCLILVSHRTGRITYKGLGDELFGNRYGAVFEVLSILACYFRMILYFIHLAKIFAYSFDRPLLSWAWVWYLLVMFLIFPISLRRNISKLRYIVILSIIGTGIYFLTTIYIAIYIVVKDYAEDTDINRFDDNPYTILKYLGLYLISFTCQANVLSVYEEIEFKTVRKGTKYVLVTYSILAGLYITLGVIGSLRKLYFQENFYANISHLDNLGLLV